MCPLRQLPRPLAPRRRNRDPGLLEGVELLLEELDVGTGVGIVDLVEREQLWLVVQPVAELAQLLG